MRIASGDEPRAVALRYRRGPSCVRNMSTTDSVIPLWEAPSCWRCPSGALQIGFISLGMEIFDFQFSKGALVRVKPSPKAVSLNSLSNRRLACLRYHPRPLAEVNISLPPLKYYLSIRTIASFGWVVCDV